MLSPRGQTVLEAEILSSASTSCSRPRPRHRASGLGISSDFVTWPWAYVYFTTEPKPMICIRHYVPCHPSTNLLFTAVWLAWIAIGRMFAEMIRLQYNFLYVAYMRVMIVSCSYLLLWISSQTKKKLSSASWFCPRPRPRPRGFVLILGLVLRSLASINITGLNRLAWIHEMLHRHGPRAVLSLEQGLASPCYYYYLLVLLLVCLVAKIPGVKTSLKPS